MNAGLSWRRDRVISVCDLANSVAIYELDEKGTISRWRDTLDFLARRALPENKGRLIKSTGDGLITEFANVSDAVKLAASLHSHLQESNAALPIDIALMTRVGINVTDVYADDMDVYGRGVNLAARVATLALPGQTVLTAAARDRMIPGVDPDVEDIGPAYFKNVKEPVTVYRVLDSRQGRRERLIEPQAIDLLPSIAVVPFIGYMVGAPDDVIGEMLADALIARLAAGKCLRTVSRLSTSKLASSGLSPQALSEFLGANYLLTGSYRVSESQVYLMAELVSAKSAKSLWASEFHFPKDDLCARDPDICLRIGEQLIRVVSDWEIGRVARQPVQSLEGYSIQLASIASMYRTSPAAFMRSRESLEALIERYPRASEPRAWLAKWFVLRATRGLVGYGEEEADLAMDHTRRALEHSLCPLALAVQGLVHIHLLRDLDAGERSFDDAIALNPSEYLAWLFRSVSQQFRGNGYAALQAAQTAMNLSPIDPLHHYYDALTSTAALAAGQYSRTVELARRALRSNANHLPTLRALTIALVEIGEIAQARATADKILAVDPDFTTTRYIERAPKGVGANWRRYAHALQTAGIPRN